MSHKQCWTVVGTLALGLSFGCADQGEGERCDTLSGNEDCASGLVCTDFTTRSGEPFGRCCPPEGEKISDDRCIQRPVTEETAGTGGSRGTSSEGGAAGQSTVTSGARGA
ncbi:MAG: hypothetical protein JW940_31295 [Polyangiaceae bacterium]|nr:hypothetical protein [Polyangiaceae bacterium]